MLSTTVREMHATSQFLYNKRRWGAGSIVWSVHRDCKALDRAGRAASRSFWHISHDELVQMVQLSIKEDNHVWSAGSLWRRDNAIPMGGSFSAQCAHLHNLWALRQNVEKMKEFGELVQTAPFPPWKTPAGNTVLMSLFRDNVNVTGKGPTAEK